MGAGVSGLAGRFPACPKTLSGLQLFLLQRYGLPYRRVLCLNDLQKTHGPKTSPGFAALCEELAQVKIDDRWSESRNGRIIEQSQILTTQNLAPLFDLNEVEVPYTLVLKNYDLISGDAKKMTDDFIDLIHEIAARGCPVEVRIDNAA